MPRPPSFSAPRASRSVSAAAEPCRAAAVGAEEAARLFVACGPFEPRPRIAAAVSGGADSLALAWLLQRWLLSRGGGLLALIVDHRLRRDSASEAAAVSAQLTALGIDSRILVWERGSAVSTGLQAAARGARYRLLVGACRAAGLVHLALGHHRDDQVETLLQRVESGSGPDGLAAMPAVAELADVRLLRPFLTLPKARLQATCRAAGLSFVEDPSNRDARFARSRLRARGSALAEAGLAPELLADLTASAGRLRAETEGRVAALLAETVSLHPAGFAELAPALVAAPDPVALRALAQLLACLGGRSWPPRTARVERALMSLRSRPSRPLTLGGCRILPQTAGWLALREPTAPVCALAPGQTLVWDGRFQVSLGAEAPQGLTVGPLGRKGWQKLLEAEPSLRACPLPSAVRFTLPTLFRGDRPLAVPLLTVSCSSSGRPPYGFSSRFRPRRGLTAAAFAPAQAVPGGAAGPALGASFTVA